MRIRAIRISSRCASALAVLARSAGASLPAANRP